tara:strand:+ start:278 stop:520 length:243 start_codon:yes stop_codon:yes gene_type:complete
MNDLTTLKMSDETISQIARLLQVAILSGTDVVDNLRTMRLVVQDDALHPDPGFIEAFESNIQKMLEEVVTVSEDNTLEVD